MLQEGLIVTDDTFLECKNNGTGSGDVITGILDGTGNGITVEKLIAALNDPDTGVQAVAARQLGETGGPVAVETLLSLLSSSPDCHVRAAAVEALGLTGDSRVQETLIKTLLNDNGTTVGWKAVNGLLYLLGQEAVDPLILALKHGTAEAREYAALALGQLHSQKAVTHLIKALKEGPGRLHGNALLSLERLGWQVVKQNGNRVIRRILERT